MLSRVLRLAFVLSQIVWMVAVLPGHVRGRLTIGPTSADACRAPAADEPSCCATGDTPHQRHDEPTPDQQRRCAVCYQAMGYDLPPVFDVDLRPTGVCVPLRHIEPQVRRRPPHRATYFATAPPAA